MASHDFRHPDDSSSNNLTKREMELKQKHLESVSAKLLDDSSPSLSAWISLINYNQSQQLNVKPTINSVLHTQLELKLIRTRWCDSCFASCSIQVSLETQNVFITCQRPTCQKTLSEPLSSWDFDHPPKNSSINDAPVAESTSDSVGTLLNPSTPISGQNNSTTDASAPVPALIENTKSRKNRQKTRSSRSALSNLLTRRKEANADPSKQPAGDSLQNFLTQL